MRNFTISRHRTLKKALFGVFFMLLCLAASAQAQRKLLSASFTGEPLVEVLRALEKMDQYRFIFNYAELDGYRVTQSFTNVEMNTALSRVLTGLPFEYTIEGIRITVRKTADAPGNAAAVGVRPPRYPVSGTVTDENGQPLAGVSIVDRSAGYGTVTDINGNYTLSVISGATLTFSFIGYETQQVAVGVLGADDSTTVNIRMVVQDQLIGGVVVDGYRTISKERAGGAYTIITEEELSRKPVTNLSSALTGMVPGMATTVSTIDGQNRFVVRGQGTLGQNSSTVDNRIDTDPLIVVDGFPIQGYTAYSFGGDGVRNSLDPFATINPNDVETVTVLRDAAATSIYGARAANGVIVITTKKGKGAVGKPNISVSGHVSVSSKPDLGYAFDMADTETTFWYMENLRNYYSGYQSTWYNPYNYPTEPNYVYINDAAALMLELELGHITQAEFDSRKAQMLADDGKWKNELNKLVYRNAVTQQYNLSIRGRSEHMNYSFSAAYDKEDTYQRGNDNQRIMLNFMNSFKLHDRVTLDLGVNTSFSKQNNNAVPMTALKNSISPWTRILDDQGNYNPIAAPSAATGATDNTLSTSSTVYYPILMSDYEGKTPASWFYNPVQDSKAMDNTSDRFTTRINAAINYRLIAGLNLRVSGQYERNQYKSHMYYKPDSYLVRNYYNLYSTLNPATGLYDSYFDAGGIFNDKGNTYEGYNFRAQADYSQSFGLHDVVLSAGTEVMSSTQKNDATIWRYGYNENTNSVLSTTDYISYFTDIFGNQVRMPYKAPGGLYTYEDRYFSAYANAAYTYNGKYTLTASARTDASNFQARDTRDKFSPFWSVAGVWLLSGEDFLAQVPWLNMLKFRTAVGEAGFAAGKYRASAITTVSTSSGSIQYSNNEPYNSISARGNASLTWEKSRTFDVGLEFRMWDGKLHGTVNYYRKHSYDVLSTATVPIITQGTSSATFNNAVVNNNGVEVALGTRLQIIDGLHWNGSLNYFYNKNEVKEYNVINTSIRPAYYPGYSINGVWAYKAVGYTPEGYVILQGKDGTREVVDSRATTHYYDTVNGAAGERVEDYNWTYFLGNSTPSSHLGFTNTFTYKGITLSFMVTGKFGYYFSKGNSYSSRQDAAHYSKALETARTIHTQGYDKQGSYSVLPLWNDANQTVFDTGSTWMYMSNLHTATTAAYAKGDHIRLNEVYLGYELPQSLLRKQQMFSQVNVFMQARNLGIIWSSNKDMDPDYPVGGIKPMSTYTFGLKFNLK